MDVYSYYKSADVDAIVPMSPLVKGQPAVDAGGVLRQVFGEVFVSLSDNEGIKHIFITFFYIFTLQPDKKLDVLQTLMLHGNLVKRKSVLDQLRKGTSMLRVCCLKW